MVAHDSIFVAVHHALQHSEPANESLVYHERLAYASCVRIELTTVASIRNMADCMHQQNDRGQAKQLESQMDAHYEAVGTL